MSIAQWHDGLGKATNLSHERLETLIERYGTRAAAVAAFIQQGEDMPLVSLPEYSRREIAYFVEVEHALHLDDVFMRRTLLAMRGCLSLNPACIAEVADVLGEALHRSEWQKQTEIDRLREILETKHMPPSPNPALRNTL
jgi:glycerol-3-phosphate dehydrogenase